MKSDALFSLLDWIYAAAVERNRWQDFLEELAAALGGAAVILSLRLPGPSRPPQIFQVHLRPELEPVLARHRSRGLPWSSGARPSHRNRFVRTSDFHSDAELASSDFYAEWMQPQELAPEGPLELVLTAPSGRPVADLAIYRRIGGRPIDATDLALCETLAPHLRRTRQLARRFGWARRWRLALAEVINRLSVGVLLIDRHYHPIITNRSADAILAQRDGLTLAADGLHATNRRDDAVLRQLLAEVIAAPASAPCTNRVMAVSRPSGKRAFPVITASLSEALPGDAAEAAVVCTLIGDPDAGQAFTPEVLRSVYSLTAAESELVGLLAAGHCLRDAAELRGVSLNTVRSQLKQVFAKTDTTRQGALIRLVLTGAAAYPDD